MVNDWCEMMLRAYNSEAENCLRVMKAGSVDTAKERLGRIGVAIEKLGGMPSIRIFQSLSQAVCSQHHLSLVALMICLEILGNLSSQP